MAFTDNRPTVDRLERQLRVSLPAAADTLGITLDDVDPELLAELLEASIDWVEDAAKTSFNGRARTENRDGNGTNQMALLRWPIGRVRLVRVTLPILALERTYTASSPPQESDEVKVYRFQGRLTIFTYKLAAEQASLHLDQQVYGNIFPDLPQCVHVDYTYGFPQYDETNDVTTWDGGVTTEAGDTRTSDDKRHVRQLATAAICDAAASFLSQAAGLGVGLVTSVSFDGFSKSLNPQAYGTQVQALIERRDSMIERRRRGFYLSTTTR